MALTAKQERFVQEYLIDLNATQAAIRAGFSAKTAGQQAFDLLKKPEIQNAVSEAQAKRAERTEIDAAWVLTRLADEATADLADILDEAGVVRPVKEWPLIWRQGLVAGLDVHEEIVEGQKIGQTVKVKLSDRIKRIELIGKHVNVQAFREQIGGPGPNGEHLHNVKTTNLTNLSDEELAQLERLTDKARNSEGVGET